MKVSVLLERGRNLVTMMLFVIGTVTVLIPGNYDGGCHRHSRCAHACGCFSLLTVHRGCLRFN